MATLFLGTALCPIVVGRHTDLSILRLRIDLGISGQGHMTLIFGEAGIGKSRLVAEAKIYATAQGMQVFQGCCFSTDQTAPYAPLLDLFACADRRLGD